MAILRARFNGPINVVACIVLAATIGWASPARASAAPNIVMFIIDDLGWTDWEHAGDRFGSRYYETPQMNRLAREGVRFVNGYSASPVCSPTRNALLTGRNPARTRMTNWLPGFVYDSPLEDPDWNRGLDPGEVTLAETLRQAGYATAFVGKWHLGDPGTISSNPRWHGFDMNVAGTWLGGPHPWIGYFANASGSFGMPWLGAGSSVPGDYLTDRLTDVAVDFIHDKAAGDEPFLLYLSHYGVHAPIRAPASRVERFEAKPPSRHHDDAVYAGMIDAVDESLGRVLDALETVGIRDETIVVVTSDNGGLEGVTSNAPLRQGKGSLYEGGIRVPMIVSWTGNRRIDAAAKRNTVVISHDIHPTLIELAGLDITPDPDRPLDGVSFRRALMRPGVTRKAAFWHYPHISPASPHISPVPPEASGGRYASAVRWRNWKLIYRFEDQRWELFDLKSDPGESRNLVDLRRRVARGLGQKLVEWLYEVDAQLPIDAASGLPVPMPRPVSVRRGRVAARFPGAKPYQDWIRFQGDVDAIASSDVDPFLKRRGWRRLGLDRGSRR